MKRHKTIDEKMFELKSFILILFTFCFVLFGGLLNIGVVQKNGGKMPVQVPFGYDYETDHHFTFQEKCEVYSYYFTDIIHYKDKVYSVGDFIMVGSLSFLIIFSIFVIFRKYQYSKKYNKSNLFY